MPTLSITLSPDLADLVEEKVKSGKYPSASEVIGDSLRMLRDRSELERMEELRREIDRGIASLERGDTIKFDSDEVFDRHFDEKGSQLLAARKRTRPIVEWSRDADADLRGCWEFRVGRKDQ